MTVAGVDACRAGWIAVLLPASGMVSAVLAGTLDELAASAPQVEAFGVDIPIGCPSTGRREADLRAREVLGPRRNSVFHTPVRDALTAPSHRQATAISRRRTGHGVSQQAYALGPKILEAERWSRSRPVPVWEVHPEVSFTLMLGHPATAPKTTWHGIREREQALAGHGIVLDDDLGDAGREAGVDDVLDAAAAAWSAARLLRGEGIALPDPPETDPASGRPMAIWA